MKNVGDRDGLEVSQCYIRDCVASMVRPQRELKGFSKNFIKAAEGIEAAKRLCEPAMCKN